MKELLRIFAVFFKIGSFSFGGGYAMVLLIQREVVNKQKWVSLDEFIPLLGLAQSAPGPLVVNTSIMIGFKLKRTKGAVAAALGSITPSFIIMLLLALLFSHVQDNEVVARAFMGIRPAIASLVLTSAIIFARKTNKWSYPISAGVAAAIFFGVSPLLIIIATLIFGISYTAYKIKKTKHAPKHSKQ